MTDLEYHYVWLSNHNYKPVKRLSLICDFMYLYLVEYTDGSIEFMGKKNNKLFSLADRPEQDLYKLYESGKLKVIESYSEY